MSDNAEINKPYTAQNFGSSPTAVAREFERGLLRHETLISKIDAAIRRIENAIKHFNNQ